MWPMVGIARSAGVATSPLKPGVVGRLPPSESLHRATPGTLCGELGTESPGTAGGVGLLLTPASLSDAAGAEVCKRCRGER
jgi:hypothetical protein